MKKIILIVLIYCFNGGLQGYSQSVIDNIDLLHGYNAMNQEGIYIHQNTALLFSGEKLFYKIYCLNSKTDKLSHLSKIAYVELVGRNNQTIFKHKIKLTGGTGQGDFLIPSSVESGAYKLIGYTRWMKNGGEKNFFQNDCYIINPYKGNKEAISNGAVEVLKHDNKKDLERKNSGKTDIGKEAHLSLSTEKNKYKTQSKVSLTIKSLLGEQSFGRYSVSVRKMEELENYSQGSPHVFIENYKKNIKNESNELNDSIFLPELRGELIKGQLFLKNTNVPVPNKSVSISLPGKNFIIRVASSNENGVFYFNINKNYNSEEAVIQVFGMNKDQVDIVMDPLIGINDEELVFDNLRISSTMKQAIVNRSVYNQIENGYFEHRKDSLVPIKKSPFLFKAFDKVYDLDEYTRFSTVREVFVEIIEDVWLKRMNDEKYVFQVRSPDPVNNFKLLPWLIVDGVLVQNHTEILDFNAKKIKSVSVSRERMYYGSQVFEGLIVIETIDGRFHENDIHKIKLFKPLQQKQYFEQVHNPSNDEIVSRIPDFRNQLLWNPNLNVEDEVVTLNFYTSSNKGNYEITIEGFTHNGQPVSVRKMIQVE